MLMTHRHAELLVPSGPDTHIQYWQYVEQSTIWPWFYAELVSVCEEGDVATMLMIPNVPVLEQVLAELDGSKRLNQVLVVTPSEINGSDRWQMEPLIELSVARNSQNEPLGYIFQVEDGRAYTTCHPLSNFELGPSRPIYSSANIRG
jgi:hypothetical protein